MSAAAPGALPGGPGSRPAASPRQRLAPLTGALALAATAGWVAVSRLGQPQPGPVWVPLLLAAAFVLTESTQVHVELRSQAVSLSLSEIPLVLGLLTLPPGQLLAARLVGLVLVSAVRGMALHKLLFNLLLVTLEVALVVLVYRAAGGATGSEPPGPGDWLATSAAVLLAALVSSLIVATAIGRVQGRFSREDVLGVCQPVVVSAVLNIAVALVVIILLRKTLLTIPLLVVLGLAVAATYRGYSTLLRRHQALGRMRRFSADVNGATGINQLYDDLLRHARELLSADHATLWLVGDRLLPPITMWSTGDAPPGRSAWPRLDDDTLVRAAVQDGESALVVRRERDPGRQAWLAGRQLRDAVLVPITSGESTLGALLVGNRLGETSTFGAEDLQVLELVAAQAAVALSNCRLLEQLRHDANHDALTGLPNRSLFQARLSEAIAGRDGRVSRLAVLLMDLDGFKDVNDTLGHHHGDLLLVQVARRLRAALPETVTVARLGGDEFAVLLPVGPDLDDTMSVAELLHGALRRTFDVDGIALEVRASLGVAAYPDHGGDATVLLQRADLAMYAAKDARVPVQMYDAELDQASPRRLALVGELRTALEEQQLTVHYQPQMSLQRGGAVYGVEALVRWRHPLHGLVAPDEFIPMAEHTGFVVPLTDYVLADSLRSCRYWQDRGHRVQVSVNISPRSLLSPGFVHRVTEAVAAAGVPPQLVTLEITESSVMRHPERALSVLEALAELGLELSIDDFGTGYSSLSYLQKLPVHEVKIDKSFVQDLSTHAENLAIVGAIVDMGHTLGLRVVAEGVEDEGSRGLLQDLGCDVGQGYLFSRPLDEAALGTWLEREFAASLPV